MLELSSHLCVPPLGTLEAVRLQKMMDMDIGFQLKWKELQRLMPHLLRARLQNGSNLQMSTLLRSYFKEYLNRYWNHGPDSFPSSFNVMESFMQFHHEYRVVTT